MSYPLEIEIETEELKNKINNNNNKQCFQFCIYRNSYSNTANFSLFNSQYS